MSTLLLVSDFLGAPLRPRAMGHTRAGHKSIALLRRRFASIPVPGINPLLVTGYDALKNRRSKFAEKCSE